MFPHIFKYKLFHEYSNKGMDYVAHCQKNPLSQSIDTVWPGVKSCLKNKQILFIKMIKVLKK